jgi:capsular polysaccharide export protein
MKCHLGKLSIGLSDFSEPIRFHRRLLRWKQLRGPGMSVADDCGPDPGGRRVLFLQGPASSFFSHLGVVLARRGHAVHRINFHGGDQVFWQLPDAVNYRGRDRNWAAFLERMILQRGITDIILFGDCRPRHSVAVAVARRLQILVHVFEEGYIRPNWVTLEVGGVNGHSGLSRDPDWYRKIAADLPDVPEQGTVPSSFARRAREDLAYNFGYMVLGWSFPFYRTHRPWHPLVEYGGWCRRLVRRRLTRGRIATEVAAVAALGDFYVFPLQLDCDSQVRLHSRTGGIAPAIDTVLASFANNAPAGAALVVKEHPLDNGLRDWRREVAAAAARHGVSGRVFFVEDGDLAEMARMARGMVTINSTSATLALAVGVPVIALGHAVYDIPGLTFQGTLEMFWENATPPDVELYAAFRRVLVHRCLVRGGFFSDEACAMLGEAAMARIEATPVLAPIPAPAPHAHAVTRPFDVFVEVQATEAAD